ncbi:hypothetical protein AB0C33_49290 [Nonomuraea sp. NPDC048881]|uniref:FG-GAP repeat protein n=1 Tax=Nonomuraea sp. NPDC048881 TaxID=3155030 RepID=UPI00340FC08A
MRASTPTTLTSVTTPAPASAAPIAYNSDFNGDGYHDLAVGMPFYRPPQAPARRARSPSCTAARTASPDAPTCGPSPAACSTRSTPPVPDGARAWPRPTPTATARPT